MHRDRLKKIFGVGPLGALISLGLLSIAAGINHSIGFGVITRHTTLVHLVGGLLVVLGLGLHIWSFVTLRNWWEQNRLCTDGPFRYFRHPMYAAWITFIATGFVLIMNAWSYLVWMVLLHPIWHALVRKEEKTMRHHFGEAYRSYAARTGRFLPRMRG
jgi:protein-S-isoprenylcysteine O-methyltransferase Ste14